MINAQKTSPRHSKLCRSCAPLPYGVSAENLPNWYNKSRVKLNRVNQLKKTNESAQTEFERSKLNRVCITTLHFVKKSNHEGSKSCPEGMAEKPLLCPRTVKRLLQSQIVLCWHCPRNDYFHAARGKTSPRISRRRHKKHHWCLWSEMFTLLLIWSVKLVWSVK